MKNVLALDIDDAILPSDSNYFGRTNDSLEIFEINLKRLVMILDKYDMEVFITSSWYVILKLVQGKLLPSIRYIQTDRIAQFDLLKKYLDERVIGLSCGDRETDINILCKKGYKVVIIDDMDLSHLENENCLFCDTRGLITGNIGYKIHKFMEKRER